MKIYIQSIDYTYSEITTNESHDLDFFVSVTNVYYRAYIGAHYLEGSREIQGEVTKDEATHIISKWLSNTF
jgi:hypothetical protein